MVFNNISKNILCIYLLFFSCGNGTCYRSFLGKIESNQNKTDLIKATIERCYNNVYMSPETLMINEFGIYSTERIFVHPQSDCQNDCSKNNATLPESIRIKIINMSTRQDVKDTVFKCYDFNYNGDDIELPTIAIP